MGLTIAAQQPGRMVRPEQAGLSPGNPDQKEKAAQEQTQAKPVAPRYDAYIPEGRGADEPDGAPKAEPGAPEGERCTVNTDQVDAELEKLREKRQELQEKLNQAAGDPEEQEKLRRELAGLEGELASKDNDTYRKQHAQVRMGG